MNSIIKMVTGFTILILIVGCRTTLSKDEMPYVGVSSEEMNKEFQLSVPLAINTFKIGSEVFLEVKVISTNQVAFERDFGARLFILENDQWIEIPNFMGYDYLASDVYVSMPYADDPFNLGATVVVPKPPDTKRATTVRIFLVGSIYRDGQVTNEKVASYVDVYLKP
jgi:hypothetical protein